MAMGKAPHEICGPTFKNLQQKLQFYDINQNSDGYFLLDTY